MIKRCLRSTLFKSINKFAGARNRLFLRWWEMKRSIQALQSSRILDRKPSIFSTSDTTFSGSNLDWPWLKRFVVLTLRRSAKVSWGVKISLQVLILSNLQFEKNPWPYLLLRYVLSPKIPKGCMNGKKCASFLCRSNYRSSFSSTNQLRKRLPTQMFPSIHTLVYSKKSDWPDLDPVP